MELPRRRFTSAHVMSAIALFVSLGGGAYALSVPAHSVGTKQLKNLAVTSRKIAKHAVTGGKIGNRAVGSGQLGLHVVGDDQLNLSQVNSLVKGNGQLSSATASTPAGGGFLPSASAPVLADVPGFGKVKLILCGSKASSYLSYVQMLSDDNASSFLAIGQGFGHPEPPGGPVPATVDGSAGQLGSGGGTLISAKANATAPGMDATFDIQFSRGSGSAVKGAHVSVALFDDGTSCSASAQTIIQN